MMVLLVRSDSSLRTVPVEKVARLMWFHHEPSDLVVWSDGQRVGHLRLHPKVREGDGARVLEYSGNVQVRLPGSPLHRISWDGVADFDADFGLTGLLLGLGVKDVSLERAEIVVKPSENRAHFRVLNVSGVELESSEYSLDEQGLKKILRQVDLDPAIYDSLRSPGTATPKVSAQESSLMIHHERAKTYLIEVRQGGQTLLEAHISELGQVLRVKTLVGYSFAPDDLLP